MDELEYSGPQDSNSILKNIWKELRLLRNALEGRDVHQGRETVHMDDLSRMDNPATDPRRKRK